MAAPLTAVRQRPLGFGPSLNSRRSLPCESGGQTLAIPASQGRRIICSVLLLALVLVLGQSLGIVHYRHVEPVSLGQ